MKPIIRKQKQYIKVGDFLEIYREEYDYWPKWVSKQEKQTITAMVYEIEAKPFTINGQPFQIAKVYDIATNTKYDFEVRNSSIVLEKEYYIYTEEKNPILGCIRKKEL
jgi:hypothetical protein